MQNRSGPGHLNRKHLALERPDRWAGLGRKPRNIARPRAGGDDDSLGLDLLIANAHAGHTAGIDQDFVNAGVFQQISTGIYKTGLQRTADQPVVYLMIFGAVQGTAHAPAEIWLLLTRLVTAQPRHIEPEIAQVGETMLQELQIVTIQRNNQRPLGSVIDVNPGLAAQLIGKGRPHPAAFHRQRQQRLFGMFGLGLRRQHAGRRPGGGHGGFVAVDDGDGASRFRQAPADPKPAYATANDDDHDVVRTVKISDRSICRGAGFATLGRESPA